MRCYICGKGFESDDDKVEEKILTTIRCGANPGREYMTMWKHKECKR